MQSGNPGKFPLVVGDLGDVQAEGVGGDEGVEEPDGQSTFFQVGTQFAIDPDAALVEGQDFQGARNISRAWRLRGEPLLATPNVSSPATTLEIPISPSGYWRKRASTAGGGLLMT